MSASQSGSAAGSDSATTNIVVECCSSADTTAYSKASTCRFCSAPGMVGRGTESAEMLAGPISSGCQGQGSVGSVSASCSGAVLSFTINNQPGSTPSIQFFTRCADPAGTCPAWTTPSPSPKVNGLTGPTPQGVTKFSARITGCPCTSVFWGLKQVGRFAGYCAALTGADAMQARKRFKPRRTTRPTGG
jgi:hypothetical protein